MDFLRWFPLSCLRGVVVTALAVCIWGCATGDDESRSCRVAVLSAFPAELAPFLEQASIDGTIVLNDRRLRVGTLGGVPVILGLTGIGMINAAMTTRAVLERFAVTGVVISGVAGSSLRIGDVAVPVEWALENDTTYAAHREWLGLAEKIAAPGAVLLERCTRMPAAPLEEPLCLPHEPAVVVGGVGQSSDPFGEMPFPCRPNGGDVFGCDVTLEDTASGRAGQRSAMETLATVDAITPTVTDMETAAIGREATLRGIPFIAFRAVSDGAGDPLGLPGFPAQFFVYYRLAARNAAAATVAFLERVACCADR